MIEACIEIHAQKCEQVTKGTILLLNAFHVVLGKVVQNKKTNETKTTTYRIVNAARDVTEMIQSIEGVSIHEVLYNNNVLLNIKCASARSMKKVLKKLLGSDFEAKLSDICEVLKQEFGTHIHVKSHVMESSIKEVENHLSK